MADVSHASSLNLEPNPFEQSFASNTQQGHAPAASTDASASAVGPSGAAPHDQAKQATQHFAAGAAGLDQKTPIPGIDKMLTPLPLAPGAPPFGAAGPLNAQLGLFGANSPAGWLPPRFGPITPGALNTPSLDAFAAQHAAGNVHTPHGFPQVPPGVPATHVQGGANATDVNVNGLPRGDAFGRPSQGVLPLESPGINALVGMTPAGVPAQISGVPGVHAAANAANAPHVPALQEAGAGPKPQGESAAANGLYMLSQNRSTENAQATPQAQPEKPRKGEPFTVPGETKRRASQQQPQHQPQTQQTQQPAPPHPPQKQGLEPQRPNRPSVDSSASGSVDESLSAVKPHVSRSRNNSSSKKRSSMDGDEDDVAVKSDGGAEDEHGEKRRWTNSQHSSDAENEEKRKQFLERNRIAAIKCRARKKQWVDNLQQKVDMYTRANDELAQKSDKMRADLDELRQFILRFHDMRSLPQHILHIVQGNNDPAGAGAVAAAGHDFAGMPSHVIAGAMAGALPGHAPLQAPMPPSVSSGPQSMTSSIVPSPASQRTAPPRAADPRYAPHAPAAAAQSPQSHYVPSRQQTAMQQPAMQHIHQTTQ